MRAATRPQHFANSSLHSSYESRSNQSQLKALAAAGTATFPTGRGKGLVQVI